MTRALDVSIGVCLFVLAGAVFGQEPDRPRPTRPDQQRPGGTESPAGKPAGNPSGREGKPAPKPPAATPSPGGLLVIKDMEGALAEVGAVRREIPAPNADTKVLGARLDAAERRLNDGKATIDQRHPELAPNAASLSKSGREALAAARRELAARALTGQKPGTPPPGTNPGGKTQGGSPDHRPGHRPDRPGTNEGGNGGGDQRRPM